MLFFFFFFFTFRWFITSSVVEYLLVGWCIDNFPPSDSLLCNSAAPPSLLPFPLCSLCILDMMEYLKRLVRKLYKIYLIKRRCTDEKGKEDEGEECERALKKRGRTQWEKRYELSVVKDNKVWKVFPLFDVLPSGALWQTPRQNPS